MSSVSLKTNQTGFGSLLSLAVVAVSVMAISLTIYFARSWANTKVGDIAITHANCNDNQLPHIVYEIWVIYPDGITDVLKYGISSQLDFVTKDGNPRPEYQIPAIQQMPRFKNGKVWYKILYSNVPGRLAAKAIEQQLVDAYFAEKGFQPLLQKLPIPTELKNQQK